MSWFRRDNTEEAERVAREAAEELAETVGRVDGRTLARHQVAVDKAAKQAGLSEKEREAIEAEFFYTYMERTGQSDRDPRYQRGKP